MSAYQQLVREILELSESQIEAMSVQELQYRFKYLCKVFVQMYREAEQTIDQLKHEKVNFEQFGRRALPEEQFVLLTQEFCNQFNGDLNAANIRHSDLYEERIIAISSRSYEECQKSVHHGRAQYSKYLAEVNRLINKLLKTKANIAALDQKIYQIESKLASQNKCRKEIIMLKKQQIHLDEQIKRSRNNMLSEIEYDCHRYMIQNPRCPPLAPEECLETTVPEERLRIPATQGRRQIPLHRNNLQPAERPMLEDQNMITEGSQETAIELRNARRQPRTGSNQIQYEE